MSILKLFKKIDYSSKLLPLVAPKKEANTVIDMIITKEIYVVVNRAIFFNTKL